MPRFVILSAHRAERNTHANAEAHCTLGDQLRALRLFPLPVRGCYTHQDGTTVVEDSYLVPIKDDGNEVSALLSVAEVYGQESILLDTDGEGQLVFLPSGNRQSLGRRTPGIADNYTSTPLGEFHYE